MKQSLGKDRCVPKHYADGTKFRLGNTFKKDKKTLILVVHKNILLCISIH